MRGQVFVAAAAMAAAVLGAAQPAAAQQYRTYHEAHVVNAQCQQSRQNRTVGGAVIGGVLGAVLGHNVAGGHGSRDEGTALGAVVGAVAGGAIGRNTAQCAPVDGRAYEPYYGQAYGDQYGQNDGYYRDDELAGGPYRESGYRGGNDGYYNDGYRNQDCRPQNVTRYDRRGRRYTDEVMMCRGNDGRWYQQG